MSTTINARQVLDFALLQSAAECYFNSPDLLSDTAYIQRQLSIGNNDPDKLGLSPNSALLPGATRFTTQQAQWFTANYKIITHYPNDNSGFSATLFQNIHTGEYTLSFRSTEYQLQDRGGDYERDGPDGADGDISDRGFGLAQLSSMEEFYRHLKEGEIFNAATRQWEKNPAADAFVGNTPTLNVTGYSLGAHLASSFTLMHTDDIAGTWTFNAAGLGGIPQGNNENTAPTGGGIRALIDPMKKAA